MSKQRLDAFYSHGILSGTLKQLAGGASEVDLDARDVRQLLRALSEHYPKLAPHLASGYAIAIDGEIFQDACAMDDAITLIEAAAAKATHHAAAPRDIATSVHLGEPNKPPPVAKSTRVIHAAEFSGKTYLETEADVDAFVSALKAELLAAIHAGQMARVQ